MKKLFIAFSLIFISILGYGFKTNSNFPIKENKGIEFYEGSLKDAMARAKKENKLIFLDVYAVWCGPCKQLKNTTFKDKNVAEFINKEFISLEINGEEGIGKEIVKKYQLKGYPSLIFIDGDGKLINKSLGYYDSKEFLEIAKSLK